MDFRVVQALYRENSSGGTERGSVIVPMLGKCILQARRKMGGLSIAKKVNSSHAHDFYEYRAVESSAVVGQHPVS
jgi:hypothetical protein